MNKAYEIWTKAIPYIKEKIMDVSFETAFKKLNPEYIENGTFYFSVPNKFYKDIYVTMEHYIRTTKDALLTVTDEIYEIEVFIKEEEQTVNKQEIKKTSDYEFKGNIDLNPKYSFQNFIVGTNSEFAYAAAYSITQGPVNDDYNPLFLYGGSGLGKTHLLHAIGNEIKNNDSEKNVLYVTAESFMNSFINSIKEENNVEFREKFRNVDVLLIDDIQFLAGKEGTQIEFFHTFNSLVDKNKQIVITSDRPPKDIAQLDERLKQRFSSRIMIDIQPPDFETRVAILHSKAKNNDFTGEISDEIINLIAQRIKSSIRELEGAMKTIMAYSDVSKKEVDIDKASEILKRYFDDNQKRKIDSEFIIKEVEKYFNLSENSLISKNRSKAYAVPRQYAMYIVRELTKSSCSQIGRDFQKDHTTVMHNINKVVEDMKNDLKIYNTVNDLIKNIKDED